MPDAPGLALETWGILGGYGLSAPDFHWVFMARLNRLGKKSWMGARVTPSAAKAAPVCNSLRTT